jgi:putative ABC transport system ATP-binding protein
MAEPPDNDVLWARGLHHAYGGSPALQGVSLGVRVGEILSVTGPRGSGKTTLLSCLSGQLDAERGEVWFNSVPVHTLRRAPRERLRRERFGWIGSSPQLVPELSVWENAALPLLLAGAGHRAARTAAREWLERLDVGDCARLRPASLLRPERQRVALARALVHSPDVLFADEPTAALHAADRAHVLRTLTTAARSHRITVVLATHDPAVIAAPDAAGGTLVDRTLWLADGRRVATPQHASPARRAAALPQQRKAGGSGGAAPQAPVGGAQLPITSRESAAACDGSHPEGSEDHSHDSEDRATCSASA